jgi:hypothetical protein
LKEKHLYRIGKRKPYAIEGLRDSTVPVGIKGLFCHYLDFREGDAGLLWSAKNGHINGLFFKKLDDSGVLLVNFRSQILP